MVPSGGGNPHAELNAKEGMIWCPPPNLDAIEAQNVNTSTDPGIQTQTTNTVEATGLLNNSGSESIITF
ncbi:hypothetical protein TBK1r_26320 [Stieleria magnilauensis]|uniref:Uncharacterized protein n=2 Tax=Stieleria magnilauensis TaxID=2527963 RepID=A0ABX5XQQ1_9BACT|nr:hypothetical protein TBK1r_26320 [Planctomycetes bacterium TBK1r]